jgi:hypothetical protein
LRSARGGRRFLRARQACRKSIDELFGTGECRLRESRRIRIAGGIAATAAAASDGNKCDDGWPPTQNRSDMKRFHADVS